MYKNKNEKVKIYAIPFMSSPISCDEKQLRQSKYFIDAEISMFTDTSLNHPRIHVAKAKIDMRDLRLIMDFHDGNSLYMDGTGVVKYSGYEYYTFPWLFVYLMSALTVYRENAKGNYNVIVRL